VSPDVPAPAAAQQTWRCPVCGHPTPGPVYCDHCGATLVRPEQAPAPGPRKKRGCLWLGVWAAVLLIAAVAGFAYGFITNWGEVAVPTAKQQNVIDAYGAPAAFVVADGPSGPGEDDVRMEEWIYPETGVIVYFINGRQVAEEAMTFTEPIAGTSSAPWRFEKAMRVSDVEELLGESGIALSDVDTVFDGYEAYAYEGSRLLVGYLDGRLYTVQTY